MTIRNLMLDSKKTDNVVESWIGKPTVLKCAIFRNRILKTSYMWQVVSEKKDITRGIKKGGSKTSYTFIPQSDKDFARYKCTISTEATIVEHEILVQQIFNPGPPLKLNVQVTNGGRYVRLFWCQPKSDGGSTIIKYEVIVTGEDRREIRKSTTELSAGVTLTDKNRYEIRVCSVNKVEKLVNSSCTKPREIKISPLRQKGNQNRLGSHRLLNMAGLMLVYWII
ncbi:titin-like isoform X2 [Dendronephthya gigantea]|uniref:titin-like isoform X2 n=1 Tax=Dendronephthya gigantea TaxID=151771 RepID=UPI00106A6D1D|nr:titin-like isoform X2 [Dendronephthya gigantea]